MKFYGLDKGKKLVKLARFSVETYFEGKEIKNNEFKDKRGVFVTIHSWPSNKLRGCVGYVKAYYSLSDAVIKAARAAAFSDLRFSPLRKDEQVVFEVSVLTEPELLNWDYLGKIIIGRDGLIVEMNGENGLLLPQVATQVRCDAESFLELTCEKAGLDKNSWKDKRCKVYRFRAEIFGEKEPNGEIIEKS